LIGRDAEGKFKHHENYLQLKDKINEQEKGHQKMFDTINEKLNDQTFLQQAMKVSETVSETTETKANTKKLAS
jgi:hypothetical protein